MVGIPVFIEVEGTRDQPEINVCSQTVSLLMAMQIAPIGMAGTLEETAALLKVMAEGNYEPAIFIINTFGARYILPGLDPLIGERPVIYVRREMFAGESGLLDRIVPLTDTFATLTSMSARLTSFWFYGSRNSGEVAARLTQAVTSFLSDGDFRHVEQSYARLRSRLATAS